MDVGSRGGGIWVKEFVGGVEFVERIFLWFVYAFLSFVFYLVDFLGRNGSLVSGVVWFIIFTILYRENVEEIVIWMNNVYIFERFCCLMDSTLVRDFEWGEI